MAQFHANLRGIAALLSDRMYQGNPIETSCKELIQNCWDAIKTERKSVPGLFGLIKITIDSSKRTLTVVDNGCGMTKEVIETAFFGIGCSNKEGLSTEERSGGFGAAKVQFLTFPKAIELVSVKNGIATSCSVTRDDLLDAKEFELKQEYVVRPNGTSVTLHIPERDAKGNSVSCWLYASTIKQYLPIGDLKVEFSMDRSTTTFDCNNLFEYPYIGTASTCFGLIDIYMSEIQRCKTTGLCTVYSAGVKQFQYWYGSHEVKNAHVILNVKPCVDAHDELYPINNQRQGWSGKVKPEVSDLETFLTNISKSIDARKIKRLFSAASSTMTDTVREKTSYNEVDERAAIIKKAWETFSEETPSNTTESSARPILSVSKITKALKREEKNDRTSSFKGFDIAFEEVTIDTSGMDISKSVLYNNTDMRLGQYKNFLDSFGGRLIEFRDKMAETTSIVSSDQFWGVALDKSFLGVRVNPKMFNFIGVNPFGFDFDGVTEYAANIADAMTEWMVHIIIHEVTHNKCRGHNADFCAYLAKYYGVISALPWFPSWKRSLRDLVADNDLLLTEAARAYQRSSNIDNSILNED